MIMLGGLSAWEWVLMVGFMASGVATPLLVGFLSRQGACGARTMFSVFPNYAIMTLTICGDWRRRSVGTVRWRGVAAATVVDAVSQGANYTGLVLAGSSTYILIYASVTVWVAVFSRLALGRRQSRLKWLGCALVSGGVAITGARAGARGSGTDVALGAALVAAGSVGHSGAYVLMEWNTAVAKDPIAPARLASLMGCGGALLYGVYEVAYVAPRWGALVTESVRDAGGNGRAIALAYAALTVAFWVHAYAFYALMTRLGATAAGVYKGLQAAGVLVASHALFCSPAQPAQCFDATKAASFVVIAAGVSLFSAEGAGAPDRDVAPEGVALVGVVT